MGSHDGYCGLSYWSASEKSCFKYKHVEKIKGPNPLFKRASQSNWAIDYLLRPFKIHWIIPLCRIFLPKFEFFSMLTIDEVEVRWFLKCWLRIWHDGHKNPNWIFCHLFYILRRILFELISLINVIQAVIPTITYKIYICRKKTLFTRNKISRIVSVVCFPFCLIREKKI